LLPTFVKYIFPGFHQFELVCHEILLKPQANKACEIEKSLFSDNIIYSRKYRSSLLLCQMKKEVGTLNGAGKIWYWPDYIE